MTQAPIEQQAGPVIPVKPAPNVYTVLLAMSVLALVISISVVLWRMTGHMPQGYELPLKHVFQPSTPLPGP
ncbi:MAG: hypothetical protein KGY99_03890 [Phycisphaerae bacterium]|nr:hypothetical protein [Phycisphaerae bacterium]